MGGENDERVITPYSVKVEVIGMDVVEEKLTALSEKLEEAKALANELASIELEPRLKTIQSSITS